MNYNFHASDADAASRFINVMLEGTYVRPHRHITPPKPETAIVLEGSAAAFIFDDRGAVIEAIVLGGPHAPAGIDFEPGVWHTVAALSPHAVCFEVKPGPYDAATDKEFASWAPLPEDPGAAAYLDSLVANVRR